MFKFLLVGLFLFWGLSSSFFVIGEGYVRADSEVKKTCDGIQITEIMPYPSDGKEWVELYNQNDYDTDIQGCFISDISSGTHYYPIKDSLVIQAKKYYAFYGSPTLSLNNTPGDGARFLDYYHVNIKFQTPKYDKVGMDQSFAYDEKSKLWQWTTTPTPGSENVITEPSSVSSGEEEDDSENVLSNGCSGIMITELMPSPVGPDGDNEWIELYNSNSEIVDLGGCIISDKMKVGSTKKYTIPKGTMISSGGYLNFMRPMTKITLNNDSDGAMILSSSGSIVFDTGLYEKPEEGLSYAYSDGQWFWTTVSTPGESNIISEPMSKEAKKKASTKKKTATKTPKSTKKSAIKNTDKDGEVLGESTSDENPLQGKINDKMMGYIMVAISIMLLLGYIVWINKDFVHENIIKKFRRDS